MPYPDSHSKQNQGNYLAVQWLGLWAPTAGGRATVSGQETILLHAAQPEKKGRSTSRNASDTHTYIHTHKSTHASTHHRKSTHSSHLYILFSSYSDTLFFLLQFKAFLSIDGSMVFCVFMRACVCVCVGSVVSDSCDPIVCSPSGSSVHRIFQARILHWVAMPFSRRSSQPRDGTHISWVSCIGRWILTTAPAGKPHNSLCRYSLTPALALATRLVCASHSLCPLFSPLSLPLQAPPSILLPHADAAKHG